MATSNIKFLETANQLKQQLDETLAENEQLTRKNQLLQRQIEDLETRAKVADERAVAAEKKRETLESLAAHEYKSVVTELFSEPSRHAARHTARWAAASIMFGLAATLWSVWYTTRTSSESSSAVTGAIQRGLARRIDDASRKASAELQATEQRLMPKNTVPIWSVAELSRNGMLWRTVPSGQDLYFRVAVPSGVQHLEVKLFTISGDANLFLKYGEPPTPDLSHKVCASLKRGTQLDACYGTNPIAGDWFIRVHGQASGYSTFAVQGSF